VLCAAATTTTAGGCDHLDCSGSGGHFIVVVVGTNHAEMWIRDSAHNLFGAMCEREGGKLTSVRKR
jgi:hypothetical protein